MFRRQRMQAPRDDEDDESSDSETSTTSGDYEHTAQSEEHNPHHYRSQQRVPNTAGPNLNHGTENISYEMRSPTTTDSERLDHIPTHPNPNIASMARLGKAEVDLEAEKGSHDRTRKELDSLKQSLDDKNEELRQAEGDKEKLRLVASERLKKLRGATHELNQLIISTQVFAKDNDSDFGTHAVRLRGDISNLSVCHLKEAKDLDISDATYKLLEQRLGLPESTIINCLQSSTLSETVQAFIWQTLRARIFGRFCWALQSSESMSAMSGFLERLLTSDSNSVHDAKRRFHTWRATTTNAMVEVVGLDSEKVSNDIDKFSKEQARLTTEELRDLLKPSSYQTVEDELSDIFCNSVALSKMIDKQLACITWSDVEHMAAGRPDLGRVEPQSGSCPSDDKDSRLLVAPGLVRSGRSSGDKFDVEVVEILAPLFKSIG
ncbi:unnamed protein product [Penicillium discolor]